MMDLQQVGASARLFAPGLAMFLEQSGAVPAVDLARARAAADIADKRLDQALLDLGLLTETTLSEVLTRHFGVEDVKPAELPAAPVLIETLNPRYLASAGVLPLDNGQGTLVLAMVDPFDDFAAAAINLKTGLAAGKSLTEALRIALTEKLPDGRTNYRAIADALVSKARDGDIAAIREVLDRTEGKLTASVVVGGAQPRLIQFNVLPADLDTL